MDYRPQQYKKQYQIYNVICSGSLLLYLDICIAIYLKVKN